MCRAKLQQAAQQGILQYFLFLCKPENIISYKLYAGTVSHGGHFLNDIIMGTVIPYIKIGEGIEQCFVQIRKVFLTELEIFYCLRSRLESVFGSVIKIIEQYT